MTELRNIKITAIGSITGNGIDHASQNLVNIPEPHHKIHEGKHYSVRGFQNLASSGNTLCFAVDTPAGSTWAHMEFQIEGNNQTEVRMWEGATLSGGTAVTPYNSNRNSNNTSILTVYWNPVVSGATPTSGTLIDSNSKGLAGANPTSTRIGGETTREDEWVLKSGTSYLWEIKTAGDNNTIDYNGYWYELTDEVQQF